MKVVYLVGLAHSGSTFLSRVINQHSNIFTAGELFFLDEELEDKTTGCKCVSMAHKYDSCPFWDEIYQEFIGQGGIVERTGRLDTNNVKDWIKAVLSPYVETIGPDFGEQNELLFNLLSQKTGCDVILDTSKRPWRLIPLLRRSDLDVYVLHLIKSPTNQIRSRVNRGYGFWHSAFMKYFRKNWLAEHLGQGERYLKVRFEDFVKTPEDVLYDFFAWVGVNYEDLFEKEMQDFHHLRGGGTQSLYRDLRPDASKLEKIEPFTGVKNSVTKWLRGLY